MKKLYFFVIAVFFCLKGYSQSTTLLPIQAIPQNKLVPNVIWVDPITYRMWAGKLDSIKLNPVSIGWWRDSTINVGDNRYVKLLGSYSNPSWITSLPSNKVTGLSTVSTTGNYNDLSNRPVIPSAQIQSDYTQVNTSSLDYIKNKPNLSLYETISHANATYYPLSNPNSFISSYTETDPVWSGVSGSYRTKVQNDGLYYPLTGNPSNFLTSFTEIDPTVPAYSKTLSSFDIIKSSTDPLYKSIGYTPSSAEIISGLGYTPYNGATNPNGYISSVPAQSFASLSGKPTTLSGYGITDGVPSGRTITINGSTFDLSSNRSWTVGDVTSASLSTTLSNYPTNSSLSTTLSGYATTSALTSGLASKQNTLSLTTTGTGAATLVGSTLNIPTPVVNTYTAGTGIGIASNVITNTAPDQTVSLTGSNGITTGGTYPNFTIQQTTPTYNNAPARTLGTSFRPSTTRPTRVSYTVSIATTLSLLNLNSAGTVQLQISSDNVNFSTINSAGITRTLAVSISVGLNDTSMLNIQGEIPAGYYCRLLSTTSGGSTVTFTSGQEVTY